MISFDTKHDYEGKEPSHFKRYRCRGEQFDQDAEKIT